MEALKPVMAAAIAAAAIFPTHSTAAADEPSAPPPRVIQVPQSPPRITSNHVGSVQTAFSAAGHARADQVRAWADLQESLGRAQINNEIARQLYLENQLQSVRLRRELRAAQWEARQARLAQQRERALARRAAAAARQASPGVDPLKGLTTVGR